MTYKEKAIDLIRVYLAELHKEKKADEYAAQDAADCGGEFTETAIYQISAVEYVLNLLEELDE